MPYQGKKRNSIKEPDKWRMCVSRRHTCTTYIVFEYEPNVATMKQFSSFTSYKLQKVPSGNDGPYILTMVLIQKIYAYCIFRWEAERPKENEKENN